MTDKLFTPTRIGDIEVANRVADAMRHIDRRDTPHMDAAVRHTDKTLDESVVTSPLPDDELGNVMMARRRICRFGPSQNRP